ncbi:MAG TPA: gephyrin-like molybdotransferase Glp [Gammaproteobacteria bacterium]|nr:gephyrin-like molybdotransferase Glp [Gammaproteobacteria bacterium]
MSKGVITTQSSCADDYDPGSLTCDEALRRLLAAVSPVDGIDHVTLRNSLGRVLAEDVVSNVNVPAYANSAMDGYAVRSGDLPVQDTVRLRIAGSSYAGKPCSATVQPGECVRITTGAILPQGADSVVIQEHVERLGDKIRVGGGHKAGDNVRAAGEDIAVGQTVLKTGRRLTPADLGLLASLGIGTVPVRRRLKVAFLSTGDELKPVGEQLAPGEIHDSNRHTLHAMLTRLGVEVADFGIVRDDRAATRAAFKGAARGRDAVISSGGVSVGEADFVKEILNEQGKMNFWKVAMKPGRPLTFGQLGDAVFFGLPGNPVSVMVTFYQFVQPALRKMMGEAPHAPLLLKAVTRSRLKKKPGRVEFQRAMLECDENGRLSVSTTGMQGSGILTSMSQANCFIILPMDSGNIEAGALVDVQPFDGLI